MLERSCYWNPYCSTRIGKDDSALIINLLESPFIPMAADCAGVLGLRVSILRLSKGGEDPYPNATTRVENQKSEINHHKGQLGCKDSLQHIMSDLSALVRDSSL